MESGDQPGFDLFLPAGSTRGLPAIVPVAMLYSTPEDAAAQMTYIKKRGYPVSYIEMGEEPEWASTCSPARLTPLCICSSPMRFISVLDPRASNSVGPCGQGVTEDIKVWPDAQGRSFVAGTFPRIFESPRAD